jgi:hypothetical protein
LRRPADPDRGGGPGDRRSLPVWFNAALVGILVWCASTAIFAVVALAYGWYRPGLVGASAAIAALGAVLYVALNSRPQAVTSHGAAAAAIGLACLAFVLAGAFHSEHLLTDRDPGIYNNRGRSIARSQVLAPKIRVGPYTDARFSMHSASVTASTDGRLYANFFPMLPALLAIGWSIGGDTGLLLVPAALGALGILVTYALASRVLDARWALGAPVVMLIVPLQLWFSRDAYSELLVQVLIIGGLWLFLESRSPASLFLAAVAGAMIASSTMARIDAMLLVGCAFVIAAVEWSRADTEDCPVRSRRRVLIFAVAMLAFTILGVIVTRRTNLLYIKALSSEYRYVVAAATVGVLIFGGVVITHRLRPGVAHRLASSRIVAIAVAVGAAVVAVWAYFIRPEPASALPPARLGMSAAQRSAFNRWYFSHSLHWFSDYFGVIGLVLIIAGFGLLGWRATRGASERLRRGAAAICLMTLPCWLAYLARPSISPDQPWAMRRFVPVLPGLSIAIAVALAFLCARLAHAPTVRTRGAGIAIAAIVVVGFLVPVGIAAKPFRTARVQSGVTAAIHGVCRRTGSDGAVFIYGGAFLDLELPQTIRGFCGVPAAKSASGYIDLPSLAADWQRAGRRLVVATGGPADLQRRVPSAIPLGRFVVADSDDLEHSRLHPPRQLAPRPNEIYLFEIPPTADTQ